jgi:hypothetical protein
MPLFGQDLSRTDLLRRVGSFAQVAGIREYTYSSGRADGVRAIAVNTGAFSYELLPGRCLDVGLASYKGLPVGYASKSGICHPAFYNKTDPTGFGDNFLAGALTTCGMHAIGPGGECAGRAVQQHGRLSNIPAEKVGTRETWDGDECSFRVDGEVRHSAFYREDLVLRRTVTSRMGEAAIHIEDEVENLDFAPSPCLLLYHAQFGFPFLDTDSTLFTSPVRARVARPGTPETELATFNRFGQPTDGAEESCFYHSFEPDAQGRAAACLFNPNLGERGMGAYVRFDTRTLPLLVQWKMLRSREYVCGLEPATARLDNRSAEEMAENTLAPLEKRRFALEIGVVEGEDECRELVSER